MSERGMDLGLMLGRIQAATEQTVSSVLKIEKRMATADQARTQLAHQINGIHHRIKAIERQRDKGSKGGEVTDKRLKDLATLALWGAIAWATNSMEHAAEIMKLITSKGG